MVYDAKTITHKARHTAAHFKEDKKKFLGKLWVNIVNTPKWINIYFNTYVYAYVQSVPITDIYLKDNEVVGYPVFPE